MQRTTSGDSLFSITSDAPCSEIFHLGERCRIDENRVGTVAFVGNTKFSSGLWIGLILDEPNGKNDGTVEGERYFQCKMKHGVFCRPAKLLKLCPTGFASPSSSNGPPSPALSVARSIASTTAATNKTRSLYARECGFDIGDRVSIGAGKVGVLKFLDRINNELYAGVQLDRPLGCCDGVYNNVRYFKCNLLYGIFVKANTVRKCAKHVKPASIEVRHTKTSTLRTWKGSQESLNSAGVSSLYSLRNPPLISPKFGSKLTTATGAQIKDSEIINSLKTCLQEKEAHLERLSNELEQRRADAENLLQQNGQLTLRIMELNDAKRERDNLARKAQEFEEQCEELNFQLDEAQVHRSVFEAETNELKQTCKELSEQLETAIAGQGQVESIAQFDIFKDLKIVKKDQHVQTNIIPVVESRSIYTQVENADMRLVDSKDVEIQTEGGQSPLRAVTVEFGVQVNRITRSTAIQTDEILQTVLASTETQTKFFVEDFSSQVNLISPIESRESQTETLNLKNLASQTDAILKESATVEVQTERNSNKTCESQTLTAELLHKISQTEWKTCSTFDNADASIKSSTSKVTQHCQTDVVQKLDAGLQICFPAQNNFVCNESPNNNKLKSFIDSSPVAQLRTASNNIFAESISDKRNIVELDVSKLATSSQSPPGLNGNEKSTELEIILKEHSEKVEQLDSTVSFLNSIISEQNSTINKLKKELSEMRVNDDQAVELKTLKNGVKNTVVKSYVRSYCDNCETFDTHITKDCPTEKEKQLEIRTHVAISPLAVKNNSKMISRPFCDVCEAFVHDTDDCPYRANELSPNYVTSKQNALAKW